MYKNNNTVNKDVQFSVLSTAHCQEIHFATLEVLEYTGVIVQSVKALEILKRAGAFVEGELVKIPSQMVDKAISSAPSRIVLCDRNANRRLFLEGNNTYFGPGPTNVYIIDPYTGERRRPTSQDTENAMRVIDALPNIDFAMDFGNIINVSEEKNDIHLLKIMLENTTKPILHWARNIENQAIQLKMCAEIAGSVEEFQKNPFVCWFTCANSPLIQSKEVIERLMFMAENNLPNVHVTGPMSGATAPVTEAGTLVIGLAEVLSGLVVSQLVKEGAPCFIGVVAAPIDMKTMAMSYGNPEFNSMNAAIADMAHFYGLPCWGTAGCTDAKIVDQQAAIEATASIIMSQLSGANLVHDVGFTEGGGIQDLAQLVMSDEIIGFVRKIVKGIPVNHTTLALDVIKSVGPAGQYFDTDHTFAHFRNLWSPTLLDKQRFDGWSAEGSLTLGDRINTKVKRIIENHCPEPLNPELVDKLTKIVAEMA